MKKNILVFGLISGLIITVLMIISTMLCYNNPDFGGSMVIGFTVMIAAFAFVFAGIKNYRDKYNHGNLTFIQGLKTGTLIALIASTFYVVTWLIEYYFFIPDFMEKYTDHVLKQAQSSGITPEEYANKVADMDTYRSMYKRPLFVVLLTYGEVLPLGLLIAIISAFILKRKPQQKEPSIVI